MEKESQRAKARESKKKRKRRTHRMEERKYRESMEVERRKFPEKKKGREILRKELLRLKLLCQECQDDFLLCDEYLENS